MASTLALMNTVATREQLLAPPTVADGASPELEYDLRIWGALFVQHCGLLLRLYALLDCLLWHAGAAASPMEPALFVVVIPEWQAAGGHLHGAGPAAPILLSAVDGQV